MHNIAILTHHSAKIMKLFPEICLSRSVTPSPNLKLNPSMMGNKIHNSLVFKTKVCLQITTQYVRRNHTVLSVCNNKVFDCELQIYFNKSDGQVVRKYIAKLALPDPVCSHAQISENLCVAL